MSKTFYATLSNLSLVLFLLSTQSVLNTNTLQSTDPTSLTINTNPINTDTLNSVVNSSESIVDNTNTNKSNADGSTQSQQIHTSYKRSNSKNRNKKIKDEDKLTIQQEDPSIINGRRNKLRKRVQKATNYLQKSLNETISSSNEISSNNNIESHPIENASEQIEKNDSSTNTADVKVDIENKENNKSINEKINSLLEKDKVPLSSPFAIFVNNEIKNYETNKAEFKGTCKEFINQSFNKTVTTELLHFDQSEQSASEAKSTEAESTTKPVVVNKSPSSLEEYLTNCINIFVKHDQAEKMKEALAKFSERLDKEINEFEKTNPQTFGDSLIDIFFSYNYFKKNFFKTLVGKDNNDSIAEEYERTVFRNKRLDSLVKISFESFLFDLHEKYENLYTNTQNKLKSKVPLEDLSFAEMIKTKEFKSWVKAFLEEHTDFNIDEDTITKRLQLHFDQLVVDFKGKLMAQESQRASLSSAIYY